MSACSFFALLMRPARTGLPVALRRLAVVRGDMADQQVRMQAVIKSVSI